MGRHTKLTPELEEKICSLIRAGNYIETACIASGIGRRTINDWREKGRAGKQPYAAFLEKLEEAEAQAEIVMVAQLNAAAMGFTTEKNQRTGKVTRIPLKGDWKAKAFWAERRLGNRWSQRQTLNVADGGPNEVAPGPHTARELVREFFGGRVVPPNPDGDEQ